MNTLPTIEVRQAIDVKARKEVTLLTGGRPDSGTYALVEQPDGLVLVREDCDTCVDAPDTYGCQWAGQPSHIQCSAAPCPACLGAPVLAWYRVCDRCEPCGQCENGRIPDYDDRVCPYCVPCPNGCVGVDGRRLVKVRRNP